MDFFLLPPPAHRPEWAGPHLRTLALRSFNMAAGPISERNQGKCITITTVSASSFSHL